MIFILTDNVTGNIMTGVSSCVIKHNIHLGALSCDDHRLLVQEGYTKTYRKDRISGTSFTNNSRYPQGDQSHAATLQRKTNDFIIFENKVK